MAYPDPVRATGATEFIDLTTADIYLEEKWANDLTVARQEKLVFAENVDRKYETDLRKGQILHIGAISHPAARAKSANTAITYETMTETETTITINTYYYTAIALEDVIKPMVSVEMLEKYLPGMGYGLAHQEDADLAALVDDGTIVNTVGTLATGLTYSNLVRADQYLNDANVPDDERVIIISPAERANFLELDQFIHRDYQDLRVGIVGSWLQYPIFVTTNVDGTNAAGHDSVMMHKTCIAHVAQIKPMVKAFYDIDYFCAKMASLTTYGSTIVRQDHGVWMKGA